MIVGIYLKRGSTHKVRGPHVGLGVRDTSKERPRAHRQLLRGGKDIKQQETLVSSV